MPNRFQTQKWTHFQHLSALQCFGSGQVFFHEGSYRKIKKVGHPFHFQRSLKIVLEAEPHPSALRCTQRAATRLLTAIAIDSKTVTAQVFHLHVPNLHSTSFNSFNCRFGFGCILRPRGLRVVLVTVSAI